VNPHKNTLHRESTAGSLVVIFPAPHAGGGLTIQHENMPFIFGVTLRQLSPFLVDRNSDATASATGRLLEDKLHTLLSDPTFLPGGGFLAVGLGPKYAMPRATSSAPVVATTRQLVYTLHPTHLQNDGVPCSNR
jgi:hypothetical protein